MREGPAASVRALLLTAAGHICLLLLQATIFLGLPDVMFLLAGIGVVASRAASSTFTTAWTTALPVPRRSGELMNLSPSYIAFHAGRVGAMHPARWQAAGRILLAANLGLWLLFVLLLLAQAAFGFYVLP